MYRVTLEVKMSETTDIQAKQQQQDLDPNATASQNQDLQETPNTDAPKPKTGLEKYCEDNPSASECLIYEE